jgi:NADH/NAD ratio-sensing transcriptional regulator Rex
MGAAVAKYALKEQGVKIVGAVDIDAAKVGKNLPVPAGWFAGNEQFTKKGR